MRPRSASVLALPLAGLVLAACAGGTNGDVTGAEATPVQPASTSSIIPSAPAATLPPQQVGPTAGATETSRTPSSAGPAPSRESLLRADPSPAAAGAPGGGKVGADVGTVAHTFTLPSTEGVDVSLESYRGDRNVVLVFYRAYW